MNVRSRQDVTGMEQAMTPPGGEVTRSPRQLRRWALPALIFALALALRLFRLSSQSIWWDEAWSIHMAQLPVRSTLEIMATIDNSPPLHFLLLRYWGLIGGFGETNVRLLSVLFGVATVAVVYLWVREMFDDATGAVAALIVAVSPLQIVYSQEARMYIMMALEYALVLYAFWRVTGTGKRATWAVWALLVLSEAAGLYTHYFFAFAVLYVNLAFLALFLVRRTRARPWEWLASQAAVVILYLPWLVISVRWIGRFQAFSSTPRGIGALAATVWDFYMSGFYGMGERDSAFMALSVATAVMLVVALALLFVRNRARGLSLLAHTLVPLGFAVVVWQFRPVIHPRYVLPFSVPLYVLIAHAIVALVRRGRSYAVIAGGLALALTGTFGIALANVEFNPAYFRDDVRSMAAYIEKASTTDDLVLVDWTDYSLGYYYRGPANVEMLDAHTPDDVLAFLREKAAGKQRCFLVHRFGAADARGVVPFALELSGQLVQAIEFPGYLVRVYALADVSAGAVLEPQDADFSAVLLTGAFYEKNVPADNAIGLALRWKLNAETTREYSVTVGLRDEQGRHLFQTDVPLLNERLQGTQFWQEGEEMTNYYILPVPVGTPPLSCSLMVGVYDGATLKGLDLLDAAGAPAGQAYYLGSVALTRGTDFATDPYRTKESMGLTHTSEAFGQGLLLDGFKVARLTVGPGEVLPVVTAWKAIQNAPAFEDFELSVVRSGTIIGRVKAEPASAKYPARLWQRNEVILDWRDVVLDANAAEGPAQLVVRVNGRSVPIAELTISSLARQFDVPPMQHEVSLRFGDVAELLGYDLSQDEISMDQKLTLTLYWRAINDVPIDVPYTVFTHILSDAGTLVGQHDGPPALGQRPTTGWVKGEIIADTHEIELRDEGYRGRGTIEVGLYDAERLVRVLTGSQDHFILPSTVAVQP